MQDNAPSRAALLLIVLVFLTGGMPGMAAPANTSNAKTGAQASGPAETGHPAQNPQDGNGFSVSSMPIQPLVTTPDNPTRQWHYVKPNGTTSQSDAVKKPASNYTKSSDIQSNYATSKSGTGTTNASTDAAVKR